MKTKGTMAVRRPIAVMLAAALCLGLTVPALAAEDITPTCDETYYATLDYYGTLMDSSVVKTYRTYGNSVLTDYGKYDSISNLTDRREPKVENGKVTFDFAGDVPNKFYFEGKTSQPYETFPWKLDLSYRLNGVPTKAEDLAGKSGVVDIILNATPNDKATEYSKNNLILTAVSAFNGDDILSLEAPGAQVQLLGNLYCVLYAVLPGETQECVIRVGTEDFSYSGMAFLAVPATLGQLDQIGALRDAEDQIESSYRTITDSMDVILATLEGMGGSLNDTADGLDQLNAGRAVISQGKDQVYADLDTALDAAGPLVEALKPATGYLKEAETALDRVTDVLWELDDRLPYLQKTLRDTEKTLNRLKAYVSGNDSESVKTITKDLNDNLAAMQTLNEEFQAMGDQLNNVTTDESGKTILVQGKTLQEIRTLVATADQLHTGYSALTLPAGALSFQDFAALNLAYQNNATIQGAFSGPEELIGAYLDSMSPKHTYAVMARQGGTESAAQLMGLWQMSQTEGFQAQMAQGEKLQATLNQYNMTLTQLKSTAEEYSGLLSMMAPVCEDLAKLGETLTKKDGILDTTGALSDEGARLLEFGDEVIERVRDLNDIAEDYQPKVKNALKDAQTLVDSVADGLSALVDAARTGEALMKQSGTALDSGTEQTLKSLSAGLRSASTGLDQTANIRAALNDIDRVITDQWNEVAGEERNLLQMDPNAPPESITDARNEGTSSIQYVMRTQEIKASSDSTENVPEKAQADTGTFWSRVKAMFSDLWHSITGIF